jgi:pimeloyl-CoA synthetase
MSKSNITGKDKEFYEKGQRMFDRIKPLKPIKPYFDTIQEDIDLLYQVNSADVDALEDAKITLTVIKEAEAGVYDEIIDEALALISKALGMSYGDAMERVTDRAKGNPR